MQISPMSGQKKYCKPSYEELGEAIEVVLLLPNNVHDLRLHMLCGRLEDCTKCTKIEDRTGGEFNSSVQWLYCMAMCRGRYVEDTLERRLHVKSEGRSIIMLSIMMTSCIPSRRDVLDRQGQQHDHVRVL